MKSILKIAAPLFFVIFAVYSYSLGQDVSKITLYKGDLKIITVDNPTRVVINNPAVADVSSVSKTEMVIVAKNQGITNLIWWDDEGEHTSQLEVFLENMSPIKERIDNLLKEMNFPTVTTHSMDSEGKVLLLGIVKSAQDIERINVALSSLKTKIINLIQVREEETVVGIDVQVLELNKDATKTLGFAWPGSITLTERSSPGVSLLGTKWSTLFKVLNLSRDAFAWSLDALIQEGKARILSQPHLSCQSGKEAELLVGGEKPLLTTTVAATTGAEATKIDYKEFGIKLKIKPTVTEEKKIKLALNVEVSEVGSAEILGAIDSPTARAYPLTKRSASTELFLNDGQTMVIGGLKKQRSEEDIRKTFFLGDVPILGLFFRRKTTQRGGGEGERGDVELFITLTPTIIKEGVKKEEVELPPEAVPPAKEEEKLVIQDKQKTKKVPPPTTKKIKREKPTVKEKSGPKVSVPRVKISPVSEYVDRVSQQIRRNFTYPWAAKEANLEGSVKLTICVNRTGQLLDVEIKQSSGYSVLDENAVNIVRQIAPYPPFPPEMKQKELWIDLPVVYKAE